jgi:hypothetical protein
VIVIDKLDKSTEAALLARAEQGQINMKQCKVYLLIV